MADLRMDLAFSTAVAVAKAAIAEFARGGIADAQALAVRRRGWNNLQGHAHSIVPLAVAYARAHPNQLRTIRARTDLARGMTRWSREARDTALWRPVMVEIKAFLASRGADVIAEEMQGGAAQTAQDIATTYLSSHYGGGQTTGGGGNTVLKRTLKLLAHTWVE